jgi:ankyrin repeat protein
MGGNTDNLFEAIENGTVADVKSALLAGADVNARDTYGISPLILAAIQHKTDMLKLLISSGADMDAKDADGETALSICTRYGQKESVRILLEAGADVTVENSFGQTLFEIAIADKEDMKLAEMFLDFGLAPDTANSKGVPLIVTAGKYGSPGALRLLLERWANVNATDIEGQNALMKLGESALFRNEVLVECVAILAENGLDTNARDNVGRTAVIHSARNHGPDVFKAVAEKCGNIFETDMNGMTALMHASTSDEKSACGIIPFLLSRGADVHKKDKNGDTVLFHAIREGGYTSVVKLLLKAGADVNSRDGKGKTPLLYAVEAASSNIINSTMVNLLLDYGANVNDTDPEGRIPAEFLLRGYYGFEAFAAIVFAGGLKNVDMELLAQKMEKAGWINLSYRGAFALAACMAIYPDSCKSMDRIASETLSSSFIYFLSLDPFPTGFRPEKLIGTASRLAAKVLFPQKKGMELSIKKSEKLVSMLLDTMDRSPSAAVEFMGKHMGNDIMDMLKKNEVRGTNELVSRTACYIRKRKYEEWECEGSLPDMSF